MQVNGFAASRFLQLQGAIADHRRGSLALHLLVERIVAINGELADPDWERATEPVLATLERISAATLVDRRSANGPEQAEVDRCLAYLETQIAGRRARR